MNKEDFEIVMEDDVYEEVFTLMSNIKNINDGNEIGAWLFGKWLKNKKGNPRLVINRFVIPEQVVSGTEIDISEESMLDTLKEFGPEECNNIVGHWHIHPFGNGSTNWSSIDDNKIKDFMDPEKNRQVFAFLLSSYDWIKAGLAINIKTSQTHAFQKKAKTNIDTAFLDNMNIIKMSDLNKDNSKILNTLKKRIEEKVKKKTYTNNNLENYFKDNKKSNSIAYYESPNYSKFTPKETEEDIFPFMVNRYKNIVTAKINEYFWEFLTVYMGDSLDLHNYDRISYDKNQVVISFIGTNKKEAKILYNKLNDNLTDLSYEFEVIMEEEKAYNEGFKEPSKEESKEKKQNILNEMRINSK